jgi:hypothetical protein
MNKKRFKMGLGLSVIVIGGALAVTMTTHPVEAQTSACANMAPTINGNMGTMVTTSQPMSNRTLAMTFSINAVADCLGFAHTTPGCTVASGNDVLPQTIAALAQISGAALGYSQLNQSFPSGSLAMNYLVSTWNQLSFFEGEIGGCTH